MTGKSRMGARHTNCTVVHHFTILTVARVIALNGVKDGFKLSVIYGPHLPVDRDNYTSAFRFRSAVEKQIKLEIELRNYIQVSKELNC
jgi:hypothetical protein